MDKAPILIAGALLGLFGIVGVSLVGISHELTAERIARNEREALLLQLRALVPPARIDNDILASARTLHAPGVTGAEATTVYLGMHEQRTRTVVFSPVVAQGYNGAIHLIVAVNMDGTLSGVRVLRHRETPGLGDKIEVERADWITRFSGLSLDRPPFEQWKVRRDGGTFDQFTGATVTPRAIVGKLRDFLRWFDANRDRFQVAPGQEASPQ